MTSYVADRKTKTISKYGLVRRTEAVLQQLQSIRLPQPCTVLDVGTADGLMLRSLMEHDSLDQCVWVGLDIQFCRLQYAKVNVPFVLQADGKNLPFCSQSADIIILTAVLKHVTGLASLLAECRRVLRLGGQVIATDPTPLGIEWGLVLGHFTRQEIRHTLNLEDTRTLFLESGFRVIHAEHFMLSPIPFRGAEVIESMLKRMRLDQFFFNQIICAECLPI